MLERGIATLLVAIGFLALYVPMVWDFGARYWFREEDNHSAILILGIAYAYYRDRGQFGWNANTLESFYGAGIVVAGLLIYSLGRYQNFFQLEGLSLPIVIAGLTLGIAGKTALKHWALPNFLLVFTVPLLGSAVDSLLVPLRLMLTEAVTGSLAMLGYPIASSGVTIIIGFAELNIAGACVGLYSMLSLLSISFLYIYFFPMKSRISTGIFLIFVPALALLANYIRVLTLVLVAYYFGTSVEMQIHDYAAYAEVAIAVSLFISLRAVLELWDSKRTEAVSDA